MQIKSLIVPSLAAIVVGIFALALGGSRAGTSSGTAAGAPAAVATGSAVKLTIAKYAFAPPALTVKVGTTVTVTNQDSTAHTATSSAGGFDSGSLSQGQSGHFKLAKAGSYMYICQFHAFMTGTIKVVK